MKILNYNLWENYWPSCRSRGKNWDFGKIAKKENSNQSVNERTNQHNISFYVQPVDDVDRLLRWFHVDDRQDWAKDLFLQQVFYFLTFFICPSVCLSVCLSFWSVCIMHVCVSVCLYVCLWRFVFKYLHKRVVKFDPRDNCWLHKVCLLITSSSHYHLACIDSWNF